MPTHKIIKRLHLYRNKKEKKYDNNITIISLMQPKKHLNNEEVLA